MCLNCSYFTKYIKEVKQMALQKPAFTPDRLEEDREKDKGRVFTIRLNDSEVENLKVAQELLQQEKISTALKQLSMLGLYVLHDRSSAYILKILSDNLRKNKRIGIDRVNIK
jgi:hypothetical protein